MHCPFAGLHWPELHSSGVHVFWTCVWTQTPPSHPAVVQGLLSPSGHGVLSWTGLVVQRPFRPRSVPVPIRFGSQIAVVQTGAAGHCWTVFGTEVAPMGTPIVGGVPVNDS